MRYRTRVTTIPDGDGLAGARTTITRQDDGSVAGTATSDSEGHIDITANGAPGNVYIDTFRGGDRFRDDSRAMRPYGQFSPAEWAGTAKELFGDGVVPYGSAFAATASVGSLTVGTGAALLNGVLGVWYTTTVLPVSTGARACAVAYSGSGRLQLVDVAQADLTGSHLTLYTYNVSGGTITGMVRVAAPILEGIMTKSATLQAVVRAATGDTSDAVGEASGNEITFDLASGVTYDIEATASVISRARAGAIAIEIDGNLSDYAPNGGDITTTITNGHTRSQTGGACLIRLFERSDTEITDYVSDLLFGSGGSGNTNFNNPGQIARDSSGNIYIADTANNRLKKHQADGTYVTSITSLSECSAVCVDSSNNIYVGYKAGTGDYRVRKYNNSLVLQWTTSWSADYPTGGLATNGIRVMGPVNPFPVILDASTGSIVGSATGSGSSVGQIACDGTHFYAVETTNERVRKLLDNGNSVATWGALGNGDGQFQTPVGIAVNPITGNIFVTDTGRDDIQEFTNTGTFVRAFGIGQLNNPTGIVVGDSSAVYVAEAGNNRIQRFALTPSAFAYDAALLFARAIPR